eukprot:COSAG01_NODE_478_length_16479_cov_45.015629_11_plen_39_part_00
MAMHTPPLTGSKDEKRWIRELLQPADSRQNPRILAVIL